MSASFGKSHGFPFDYGFHFDVFYYSLAFVSRLWQSVGLNVILVDRLIVVAISMYIICVCYLNL